MPLLSAGPPGANKNGEVVGPAGGETGGPRCLAEDQKLPQATQISGIKELLLPHQPVCQLKPPHHTCNRACLPPHPLHWCVHYTRPRAVPQDKNRVFLHFFRHVATSGRGPPVPRSAPSPGSPRGDGPSRAARGWGDRYCLSLPRRAHHQPMARRPAIGSDDGPFFWPWGGSLLFCRLPSCGKPLFPLDYTD